MAPFVLGLVLGDILDKSLRRGLTLSNGDLTPVLHAADLRGAGAITVFTMLMYVPAFNRARARRHGAGAGRSCSEERR